MEVFLISLYNNELGINSQIDTYNIIPAVIPSINDNI